MRFVIVGAAVVLLALAPRPAAAAPSVTGGATVGLGMRGNQGGILVGGFRLMIAAGVTLEGVDLVVEIDRQIGPDNRIEDSDGDIGRWYEWVTAVRGGRRFRLVRGLSLLTTAGVSLLRTRVTGPIDPLVRPMEVNRSNFGVDGAVAMMWQSGSLVVVLGGGVTFVPFSQRMTAGAADFDLPRRLEPYGTLGVGFIR